MDEEMVIIQLAGGLGNQMFQYALYLQLKELGREVKIDDVSGFAEDPQRLPALAPFGITYERPSEEELIKMLDSSMQPWSRVRRKLFGRHKKSYFEGSKLFIPEVLTWDDIYLEGYWQTEKYFQAAETQVREAYDTDKLIAYLEQTGCLSGDGRGNAEKAEREKSGRSGSGRETKSAGQYLKEINNECSVSIHVRRGDYLTPDNRKLYGGICTDAYYIEGMRQMRERYPGCRFYLFTNDRVWARRQLAGNGSKDAGRDAAEKGRSGSAEMTECASGMFFAQDITWIDLSGAADNDYMEFLLMSCCKHHILANSSFSWWASYLNKNPEKTVFAPERWLNGVDNRDFYRADMCKVTPSKEP
jgi:hypothetical protein